MMFCARLRRNITKLALGACNVILLMSGIGLVGLGCLLVSDTPRVLLSRLAVPPVTTSHPLFYYLSLGLMAAGLFICAVSMLGCLIGCLSRPSLALGMYMFVLVLLLLFETSFGVVSTLCPQMLGVNLNRDEMVDILQRNYGIPGRDQYTAAVDLAQTLFECCGISSGSDYDTSFWKIRELAQRDLRVPHSCCFLNNTEDANAFLDPQPVNSTLCQAKSNSRYQLARHVEGCVSKLNVWFHNHLTLFLIVGVALVVVQLCALLCSILVCVKRTEVRRAETETRTEEEFPETSQYGVTVLQQDDFIGAGVGGAREKNKEREERSLPLALRSGDLYKYDDYPSQRIESQAERNFRRNDLRAQSQEYNSYYDAYKQT